MRAANATILLLIASALSLTVVSCASPTHKYTQLPIELRVLHVETNRASYPLEQFIGPVDGSPVETKIAPGTIEAISIIAKAISDCFMWGYDAKKYCSRYSVRIGFSSVDALSIRWGPPKELEQARMMWEQHQLFLSHLPTPIPMYAPASAQEKVE